MHNELEKGETVLSFKLDDIKTLKDEDIRELQYTIGPEDYKTMLIKIYWFLKGLKVKDKDIAYEELMEEIEEYL